MTSTCTKFQLDLPTHHAKDGQAVFGTLHLTAIKRLAGTGHSAKAYSLDTGVTFYFQKIVTETRHMSH